MNPMEEGRRRTTATAEAPLKEERQKHQRRLELTTAEGNNRVGLPKRPGEGGAPPEKWEEDGQSETSVARH